MAAVINTNMASLNTQRNLNTSQSALNTSIQRLSSGLRVNSAKDDAAGLAVATRMDAQIRGMNVAIRNSNDAISFAQTAEGALGKVTDAMQRMRELSVQSANGSLSNDDRANLTAEFTELHAEIVRLAGTEFNGTAVLGATATVFQVGAGTTANDTITVAALAAPAAISVADISTAANATLAIDAIDTALDTINTSRATLGAVQNRFESVISSLQVNVENAIGRQVPHHGRRLRFRNRFADARPDPAAGRYRDAGAGQLAAEQRALAVALISKQARKASGRSGGARALPCSAFVAPRSGETSCPLEKSIQLTLPPCGRLPHPHPLPPRNAPRSTTPFSPPRHPSPRKRSPPPCSRPMRTCNPFRPISVFARPGHRPHRGQDGRHRNRGSAAPVSQRGNAGHFRSIDRMQGLLINREA